MGDPSPKCEAPPLDEAVMRQMPKELDREGLITRWMARAAACSMKVQRATAEGLRGALDVILAAHQVTRSVLNAREQEARFGLPEYLAGKGIRVIGWGTAGCEEEAFSCELSITDCRAGVADSGGVMVWSEAGFGRSSTLVIPIHIVLLPAERMVADLVDALALIPRGEAMPSNVVLINGPSKTADIEMNLITGVHGPKHVYVIVVE